MATQTLPEPSMAMPYGKLPAVKVEVEGVGLVGEGVGELEPPPPGQPDKANGITVKINSNAINA